MRGLNYFSKLQANKPTFPAQKFQKSKSVTVQKAPPGMPTQHLKPF